QRLMTASLDGGAFCDGARLSASGTEYGEEALVAGPQSWLDGRSYPHVRTRGADHAPSLAYRFAQVALGETDAAFSKPRSHDWDLAACDLLVHEAGGRLTDLQDRIPEYNRRNLQHEILVAGNAKMHPRLVVELARG
ncbi:MAG TPA: inositol monophosphatase family protein, partial [Afifellaceae bacterium]|nr:inositol monophosphatase family protein [Afifellaceae bacterium]